MKSLRSVTISLLYMGSLLDFTLSTHVIFAVCGSFCTPKGFFFPSLLGEKWNVLRLQNRKKVAGYPQRHTKAPCRTLQGASLIQDSACLQEQPQEFED